ncbi:MAG: YfbU family protein [Acidobacteriota bacterium]
MKLSRIERWVLSNQYKILERLYPEESSGYAEAREALERGYELNYDWPVLQVVEDDDVLIADACREIIDILQMFSVIKSSLAELDDKSGVSAFELKFGGFDGNNESKELSYARYLCRSDGGRFKDLGEDPIFNCHMPTLRTYRRMLAAWQQSTDKVSLSKEDLVRIQDARRPE